MRRELIEIEMDRIGYIETEDTKGKVIKGKLVLFNYKDITGDIAIWTEKTLTEEEIKDKIIEVLQ